MAISGGVRAPMCMPTGPLSRSMSLAVRSNIASLVLLAEVGPCVSVFAAWVHYGHPEAQAECHCCQVARDLAGTDQYQPGGGADGHSRVIGFKARGHACMRRASISPRAMMDDSTL